MTGLRFLPGILAQQVDAEEPYDFYDDFERADSTSLGANWTEDATYPNLGIDDGFLTGSSAVNAGFAFANTDMSSTDHYVEANCAGTINNLTLFLRCNSKVYNTGGYQAGWDDTTDRFRIRRADTGATLAQTAASYPSWSFDTLRFEAEGTTLRLYVNTVLFLTVTDATFSSGVIVGARVGFGGGGMDDYKAGPLS